MDLVRGSDAPPEGAARGSGPSLNQPLRIVTRCKTVEEFIGSFRRLVDERYMLVALKTPRPAGSMLRFSVQLAEGVPVFQGVGRVVDVYEPREGRTSAGVRVELVVLDEESRTMHLRLLVARTPVASPAVRDATQRTPETPAPSRGSVPMKVEAPAAAPKPTAAAGPEPRTGRDLSMEVEHLTSVLPVRSRPAPVPAAATPASTKAPPPKPPPRPTAPAGAPSAKATPPQTSVVASARARAEEAPELEPDLEPDPPPDLDAPTSVDPMPIPAHLAELAAAATGVAPERTAGVPTAVRTPEASGPVRAARSAMPAGFVEPPRTPGAEFQLPANPLGELTPESLEQFVDCTIYEDDGTFTALSHPAPPFTQPAPPPVDSAVVALAAAASPETSIPTEVSVGTATGSAPVATASAAAAPRPRTVNPGQRTAPPPPAGSHLGLVLAAAVVAAIVGVVGGYLLWGGQRAAPDAPAVLRPAESPATDR